MLRKIALLVLLLTPFAQSQEVYERNIVEKLYVDVEAFKKSMLFNITLPPSYQASKDKRYFVIFDTHPRSREH
jgi:hypothetical protein